MSVNILHSMKAQIFLTEFANNTSKTLFQVFNQQQNKMLTVSHHNMNWQGSKAHSQNFHHLKTNLKGHIYIATKESIDRNNLISH